MEKSHSVFEQFYFQSNKSVRPTAFRSYRFERVAFAKALRDKGKEQFATKLGKERSGVEVRVASLERTLVDLHDRPNWVADGKKPGGHWNQWSILTSMSRRRICEAVRQRDDCSKGRILLGAARGGFDGRESTSQNIEEVTTKTTSLPGDAEQREVGAGLESCCTCLTDRKVVGRGGMKISKERLSKEAEATGFRAEVLEKVIQLLNLLEGI